MQVASGKATPDLLDVIAAHIGVGAFLRTIKSLEQCCSDEAVPASDPPDKETSTQSLPGKTRPETYHLQ